MKILKKAAAMIAAASLAISLSACGKDVELTMVDGKVAGFILGTSMLFHYGRTFDVNDLAVAPAYQRQSRHTQALFFWPKK